ncbi:lysozyme inhibitor LprI family protein [Psychrobacillus sp. FSL W7-1457]|uniref:lysozyme inhibitor LprI family protein n=1 Tax=unclassified Psychrobacillus TaxID=2636677 RepID=UPI0030F5926E
MNKKYIIPIVTLVLAALLAACEESPETSTELDNQSQNSEVSQDKKSVLDENKSTSNDTQENPVPKDSTLKEEYLIKLNNTKLEAENLKATDSSTYALKKVEDDRWVLWDELLNEIYGALKEQLSPEEMDQLRENQRQWLKDRDEQALEASLKFKGGTQEHLEYVAVLANLTEKRCYELVDSYMK